MPRRVIKAYRENGESGRDFPYCGNEIHVALDRERDGGILAALLGVGFLSRITTPFAAHLIFACPVGAFALVGLLTGIKFSGR